MTEILVKRHEDGLYEIFGSSVGANAHSCGLGASHLYFDQKSGWYIPVSEGPATPVFRIHEDRLEIFRNGKPDFEKYPGAMDIVSCGVRASFPDTHRIDASHETMARIRSSFAKTM